MQVQAGTQTLFVVYIKLAIKSLLPVHLSSGYKQIPELLLYWTLYLKGRWECVDEENLTLSIMLAFWSGSAQVLC